MRYLAIIPILAVAACSTGRLAEEPSPTARETIGLGRTGHAGGVSAERAERGGSMEITNSVYVSNHVIKADPAQILSELPDVYKALGLEGAGLMSVEGGIFGRPTARAHRRVGERPIAQIVDCGENLNGGAGTYEVSLAVQTSVKPAPGGGSTVRSWVESSGRQRGTSTSRRRCESTGVLEREIAERLTAFAAAVAASSD
jgi:hypothetical protein